MKRATGRYILSDIARDAANGTDLDRMSIESREEHHE
jgi:hypothetical protein